MCIYILSQPLLLLLSLIPFLASYHHHPAGQQAVVPLHPRPPSKRARLRARTLDDCLREVVAQQAINRRYHNNYICIIYETCAWTPNSFFWALMVVESLSCNFKWKSKHPFARCAEFIFGRFLGLGTQAQLGTWHPAILEYMLLEAGLRHLGLGT